MKWLKRILSAGASLLAMTAAASADPISIGAFLFAGPLGSVFSFSALVTAAQIGLVVVGAGLQMAIGALNRPETPDPGKFKNTFEASDSSEINAGGRAALGGVKVFGNTKGYNRYRLIAHCKGPLVKIETYKLGGREVVVDDYDGGVTSPPYAYPGGSYVYIATKIGDGTETAWPTLSSEFPELWTSDHRVRGIAQSLVTYISPGIYTEKFGKMYQGGEPDLTVVARIGQVYDPRIPGYTWSMNGVLWAAAVMMRYPDVEFADFDWTFIGAEATKADTLVATKTGTEPRSQFSGIWLSEAKRGDTMNDVLRSIGAEIVMGDDDLIRIRLVDDNPTAEIAFTDRHMTEFSWRSGPEAVERPNVCRVRYYSPERNYEMADIDLTGCAWARIEDEITRYGEKVHDVELPFCPSASQAQRLARREFLLARADAGEIVTNMAGAAAWGLTYASIAFPDLDETPVCKMAPPRIDDEAGSINIPFAVWPAELIYSPWDPALMEAYPPEEVPDLQYESELDTPAAPTGAAIVMYPDLSTELRLAFASVTGATVAEANYRSYTGADPNAWQGMTEPTLTFAYEPGGTALTTYDFRVRFFNADDEGSYFSDVLNVTLNYDNTAPSAPSVVQTTSTPDVHFDVSVTELRVATVRFRVNAGAWSTNTIRPGQTVRYTTGEPGTGGSKTIDIQALTSNGTAGTMYSTTLTGPAP